MFARYNNSDLRMRTAAGLRGVEGAKATYRTTLQTDKEGDFEVRSTMWLLQVGKYQLTIACQGPESGPDVSEAEFSQIVNSIRFGNPV